MDDVIFAHKQRLLDVAAQMKCSVGRRKLPCQNSPNHPAVSIEHRVVTDRRTNRQTNRHRAIARTRAGIASRG